jgi:hypothetical protein
VKKILHYIPYWIKGGIIAVLYVIVFYMIKLTCVPNTLCFADPFLEPMFLPLTSLDQLHLLSTSQIQFIGQNFIKSLLSAWFIIGAVLGLVYGLVLKKMSTTPPPLTKE